MGKKLIRYREGTFQGKMESLLLLEVDIVMKNGAVMHGYVDSKTDNSLTLKNKMLNKSIILFADIQEIIIDKVA